MRAGSSPIWIAMSLIAVMLSGCATTVAPIDMAGPEWQAGYAWTYAYQASESWVDRADGEEERDNDTWSGRIVQEVFNTTIAHAGEPLYHLVYTEETDDDAYTWFKVLRQRDLGSVGFDYSTGMACMNGECRDTGVQLTGYHDDGLTYIDFPIRTGDRWSAVLEPEEWDIGTAIEGTVHGAALVETGLGAIETARITRVEVPVGLDEYEQTIREEATAEGYTLTHLELDYSIRETLYYSDLYQAVVRVDRVDQGLESARGTDPDGEPFDFHYEETEEHTIVLEGARLLPGPERSVAEAMGFLDGSLPLRDPTGEAVAHATYELAISQPHAIINAANHELVLDAVVTGDMPTSHSLHWSVRDQQGAIVHEATGGNYTPSLPGPGRFSVELLAKDNGTIVAAAGSAITGDWIVDDVISCGVASVFGVPACDRISVPVHPGAHHVLVRTMAEFPTQTTPGNMMRLEDPNSMAASARSEGGELVIEVDDFSFFERNEQPWSLYYGPMANAMMDLPVHIEVLYSSGVQEGAAQQGRANVGKVLVEALSIN